MYHRPAASRLLPVWRSHSTSRSRSKQDPETLAQLDQLAAAFPTQVQPLLDQALAQSERVHFARVLVIDNTYLQVLTEFAGDPLEYTTFFLEKLGRVFKAIFSLVEDAPP